MPVAELIAVDPYEYDFRLRDTDTGDWLFVAPMPWDELENTVLSMADQIGAPVELWAISVHEADPMEPEHPFTDQYGQPRGPWKRIAISEGDYIRWRPRWLMSGSHQMGAIELVELGKARPKRRIPLARAKKIAKRIEREIRPLAEEYLLVGSIRRKRSEIGDIEFVVLPKGWDSEEGFDEFVEELRDKGYVIKGKFRKALKTVDGVKIELYIAHHPDEMGAMILWYTGDFVFNMAMNAKAKRMKYLRNQYGLWTRDGELVLQSPDEEDFFEALDFEWHEPRERSLATRTKEEKREREKRKKKKARVAGMGDAEEDALFGNIERFLDGHGDTNAEEVEEGDEE